MIEQKFAGAGGASFVNPYHGNSEQLYQPKDYSGLGESIMKTMSGTFKSIQESSFRQGQIDQLANRVDEERWLSKDSYLKGALYAKTQNDLMVAQGRAQDIVNKGVASGKSTTEIIADIRDAQQGVFDAAEELRGTNPEAADTIIGALQRQQQFAIQNHQQQMIQSEYRNRETGDTLNNLRIVQDFMQNNDPEAFMQDVVNSIGVMSRNAQIMGVDPKTYTDNQLSTALTAPLVNAQMNDPQALILANKIPKLADVLAMAGKLTPEATAKVKGFAEQKLSQARQFVQADLSYRVNSDEVVATDNEDKIFQNDINAYVYSGGDPMVATSLRVNWEKKRRTFNSASTQFQVGMQVPTDASERTAYIKAAKTKADAMSGGDPLMSSALVGEWMLTGMEVEEGKAQLNKLEERAMLLLNAEGDNFDTKECQAFDYLYRLLTSDNPRVQGGATDALDLNTKTFLISHWPTVREAILSSDPQTAKNAIQSARQYWKRIKGDTGGTMDKLKGLNTFMDNSTGIDIFGKGLGKSGLNVETREALKQVMGVQTFDAIRRDLLGKGKVLTAEDNIYDVITADGSMWKANGYNVISVGGVGTLLPVAKGNIDQQALNNVLAKYASEKTLANGAKTEYDRGDVVLVSTPDGMGLMKVTADGYQDVISKRELREKYEQERTDLAKQAILDRAGGVLGATPALNSKAIETPHDNSYIYDKHQMEPRPYVMDVAENDSEMVQYAELDLGGSVADAFQNPLYQKWLMTRARQSIPSPSGDWTPRMSKEDAELLNMYFSNPNIAFAKEAELNDLFERDKKLFKQYQDQITDRLTMNNTAPVGDTKDMNLEKPVAVKTNNGRGKTTEYYLTNELLESGLGSDLMPRVMSELAKYEGFITDWRVTDPRYTDKAVIGLGYLRNGYPAWNNMFEEAKGDPMKLSIATNKFAVWYFQDVPQKFSDLVGADFDKIKNDPLVADAIVSCTDFMWHQGKYSKAYWDCLAKVKANDLAGAISHLKSTSAYKQSGEARKQHLLNGLNSFAQYLKLEG